MAIGRPIGTKNTMRTPEEKEKIVLEYLNGTAGHRTVADSYNINHVLFRRWIKAYRAFGIDGLRSKTGKSNSGKKGNHNRHLSEVEKLKNELAKKEIEIERLKKGYTVKGVGAKKEYVTTFDKNTK